MYTLYILQCKQQGIHLGKALGTPPLDISREGAIAEAGTTAVVDLEACLSWLLVHVRTIIALLYFIPIPDSCI